jgi:hypothetical protein
MTMNGNNPQVPRSVGRPAARIRRPGLSHALGESYQRFAASGASDSKTASRLGRQSPSSTASLPPRASGSRSADLDAADVAAGDLVLDYRASPKGQFHDHRPPGHQQV